MSEEPKTPLAVKCPRCEAAPWIGCLVGLVNGATIRSQSDLHHERLAAYGEEQRA